MTSGSGSRSTADRARAVHSRITPAADRANSRALPAIGTETAAVAGARAGAAAAAARPPIAGSEPGMTPVAISSCEPVAATPLVVAASHKSL